jgi:hypothetical protein
MAKASQSSYNSKSLSASSADGCYEQGSCYVRYKQSGKWHGKKLRFDEKNLVLEK